MNGLLQNCSVKIAHNRHGRAVLCYKLIGRGAKSPTKSLVNTKVTTAALESTSWTRRETRSVTQGITLDPLLCVLLHQRTRCRPKCNRNRLPTLHDARLELADSPVNDERQPILPRRWARSRPLDIKYQSFAALLPVRTSFRRDETPTYISPRQLLSSSIYPRA